MSGSQTEPEFLRLTDRVAASLKARSLYAAGLCDASANLAGRLRQDETQRLTVETFAWSVMTSANVFMSYSELS
jgi:hypothetical protein